MPNGRSKQKGKRGEDEGWELIGAERQIGVDGLRWIPPPRWRPFHVEWKRQEKIYIDRWFKQAQKDAHEEEMPIVIYRKNRTKWRIDMLLEDFDLILNALEGE